MNVIKNVTRVWMDDDDESNDFPLSLSNDKTNRNSFALVLCHNSARSQRTKIFVPI